MGSGSPNAPFHRWEPVPPTLRNRRDCTTVIDTPCGRAVTPCGARISWLDSRISATAASRRGSPRACGDTSTRALRADDTTGSWTGASSSFGRFPPRPPRRTSEPACSTRSTVWRKSVVVAARRREVPGRCRRSRWWPSSRRSSSRRFCGSPIRSWIFRRSSPRSRSRRRAFHRFSPSRAPASAVWSPSPCPSKARISGLGPTLFSISSLRSISGTVSPAWCGPGCGSAPGGSRG